MKATAWDSLLCEQLRRDGRFFFGLAYNILRDAAAAEDVCQQAFLKAVQAEEALQVKDALRAWLARVVVNESLQVRRRRKIERQALERHGVAGGASPEAGPEPDLREAVLGAVDQLPEATRTIVALRLLHGMTGNEVKQLLACSASEVSRQLHRGMELLRTSLSAWEAWAPK